MPPLTTNVHNMRGRTDVSHIPPMPLWMAIVRILQAILAIILLALTAYSASVFKITYAGFGLCWFTFIWTILFLAYIGLSAAFFPALYNMWAQLGLECATVFWWLITFGVLASEAAAWGIVNDATYYDPTTGTYASVYNQYFPPGWNSAINAGKAAAGLGALEWLLFIVTLIAFSIFLHRHRVSTRMGTAAPMNTAPVTEEHKMSTMTTEQPVVQQHYQQQQMA